MVDSYLAIRWMISVGTWSQELNDLESRELEGGKMLQELFLLSASCNVYSGHYSPCVNIERNNNYCLIGRVLAAAVNALHPQTKEVEIVRLVITPITMGAQIMLRAHFAGTGEFWS